MKVKMTKDQLLDEIQIDQKKYEERLSDAKESQKTLEKQYEAQLGIIKERIKGLEERIEVLKRFAEYTEQIGTEQK